MLWNKNFLFLHIPKTAGKSLTKAFVQSLERPVTCIVSKGQIKELEDCDHNGLNLIEGRGHEDMTAAKNILAEYGKTLEDFKAIIVSIRNPYDLMVSNYFFMRKTFKNNRLKENFQIARHNNFEDYAVKVKFAPLETWMTNNGRRPDNLRIIRFEYLQEDFNHLAREFNFPPVQLPHINASRHKHYSDYLTAVSEAAIYRKLNYLFGEGYYKRHYISVSHRIKANFQGLLGG